MARLCHYSGKKGLLFSRPTGRSGLNIDFQRLSSETQGSAFNLIQQLRFRLCAIHFHYLNAVVCRQAYQALRLFLIGTIHFQAHLAPIHLRGGLRQLQMRKHRTVAHQHDYRQAACFNPVPSAFIHFLRLIVYPLSFGKVNGAAGYTGFEQGGNQNLRTEEIFIVHLPCSGSSGNSTNKALNIGKPFSVHSLAWA